MDLQHRQAGSVGYSRCREQCNQAIGLGRALREGVCEGKGEKRRLPLLHPPGQSNHLFRHVQGPGAFSGALYC